MANDTSRAAIQTGGALISQIISKLRGGNQRGDAESILQALQEAEAGRAAGNLSEGDFLAQALSRGDADPRSALAAIDPADVAQGNIQSPNIFEKLLGKRDIQVGPDLEADDALAQIADIFPGADVASRFARQGFGDRVERVRAQAGIDAIKPQLADALGVDADKISPESLGTYLRVLQALPSPSTSSPLGAATELVDLETGKSVITQKDNRTGEIKINPKFGPKKRADKTPIQQFTFDPETGRIDSVTTGTADALKKFDPGATVLQKGKAEAINTAREQRKTATKVFRALNRAAEIDDGTAIGGRVGSIVRAFDSATQSTVAALRKAGGGFPKYSTRAVLGGEKVIDLFPPQLREAAIADTKLGSVAYNTAILLAQFSNPGSRISAEAVKRELEFTVGPLLSGSPEQREAGRQELARTMRENFAITVSDLGEESGVEAFNKEDLNKLFPFIFSGSQSQSEGGVIPTEGPGVFDFNEGTGTFIEGAQ